jgi:hypothetical protein
MKSKAEIFIRDSVVLFIAGILVSVAVERAISNIPIGILIAIIVLFVVYATLALGITHRKIDRQIDRFGLSTVVLQESTDFNNPEIYEKAKEIVLTAKEYIFVLTYNNPVISNIDYPTSRINFLLDGIEQVIKKQIEQFPDHLFSYKRIIQSEKAVEAGRVLKSDFMEGDSQTLEHCQRVALMMRDKISRNVNVEFFISRPVPSFPSMMIVDDKYVLLGLVTKPPKISGTSKGMMVAGALIIEDRDGKTVKGFKSIAERFLQDSEKIDKIEDLALVSANQNPL